MERRKFIKSCCIASAVIPLGGIVLQSCESLYYAQVSSEPSRLKMAKSEFIKPNSTKIVFRKYVLIKTPELAFPICVYRISEDNYISSLMTCTHQGCELNIGGGIYSCPCHGSEFSVEGEVLQGPANENLKTFNTTSENENIYVSLS